MCCPLASVKKRLQQFKENPNMVKAYVKAQAKYRESHPNTKSTRLYDNVYEQIVRDFFFDKQMDYNEWYNNMFQKPDCKKYLEDYFGIDLTIK